MSIAAQKLLAAFFFVIIMTAMNKFLWWVIPKFPPWLTDVLFFVGIPILLVSSVFVIYRHRKRGGHLKD